MNLSKTKKYFILTLSFSAISCHQPTEFSQKEGVIMPLEVGNTWSYRVTYFDSLGNAGQIDTFSTTIVLKAAVFNDITQANEEWFSSGMYYYMNRQTGLFRASRLPLSSYGFLVAKYPAREKDSYNAFTSDPGDSYIVTVVSTHEYTSVPEGSYSCYVYQWQGDNLKMFQYYAPNRGLIREDVHFKPLDGGNWFLLYRHELISLDLK